MARPAEPLPVPAIPKQAHVPSVWGDVINALCNAGAFSVLPEQRARWMTLEIAQCSSPPSLGVTTLMWLRPVISHQNYAHVPRSLWEVSHPLAVAPSPMGLPQGPPGNVCQDF